MPNTIHYTAVLKKILKRRQTRIILFINAKIIGGKEKNPYLCNLKRYI
jgi:hypothetical protein